MYCDAEDEDLLDQGTDSEAMTVVRPVTPLWPRHWYTNTKGKIEEVFLKKWADGFYIVHLGHSGIQYIVVLRL
jgi:hypothetical protein